MTNRAKKTKSIDVKQQRFKTNRVCGKSELAGFFFRSVYSVDMSEGGSYSGESLVI